MTPTCKDPIRPETLTIVYGFCLAAERLQTCFVHSTYASRSLEDVVQATPSSLKWFQLYALRDKELNKLLLKKAEELGYKAIVVTIDTPTVGVRYHEMGNKNCLPSHISCGVFERLIEGYPEAKRFEVATNLMDPEISWVTVDWLKSITTLPIVLKGILTAEDAQLAVEHGVSAIIVSNHGGRQLDGVLATVSIPRLFGDIVTF